jgi:hypothetical protein|tara:strand:+ start:326 stop:697 length:372 start_codon:yes stop_codon:yes gene_type:complete
MSATEPEGRWVGKEKTRYNFVLKYLSVNETTRGYCVHNFVDKDGARFLAFQDVKNIVIEEHELINGDCFTCKATVNRHSINNYKYGSQEPFKETVLNRIKFNEWLGKGTSTMAPQERSRKTYD